MKRLKRLWNRYNPRRTFIDCDDELIALMSQLGYIELYRGEYFFTDSGIDAIREGIRIMEREYFSTIISTESDTNANVCS